MDCCYEDYTVHESERNYLLTRIPGVDIIEAARGKFVLGISFNFGKHLTLGTPKYIEICFNSNSFS